LASKERWPALCSADANLGLRSGLPFAQLMQTLAFAQSCALLCALYATSSKLHTSAPRFLACSFALSLPQSPRACRLHAQEIFTSDYLLSAVYIPHGRPSNCPHPNDCPHSTALWRRQWYNKKAHARIRGLRV